MLLFNSCIPSSECLSIYFNTSHVTVQHEKELNIQVKDRFQYISCYCSTEYKYLSISSVRISIHLMLLFNSFAMFNLFLTFPFQYISCYCSTRKRGISKNGYHISIHLMLLFNLDLRLEIVAVLHFNTSHVTVQQITNNGIYSLPRFQYISCYCSTTAKI